MVKKKKSGGYDVMNEINSILAAALPKQRPTKKQMNWKQAKKKYPKLDPMGDFDMDGVMNMIDCKPFDKKKQDNVRMVSAYSKKAKRYIPQILEKDDGEYNTKNDKEYFDHTTVQALKRNTEYADDENEYPSNVIKGTKRDKMREDPRLIIKKGKVVGLIQGHSNYRGRDNQRHEEDIAEYGVGKIDIGEEHKRKGYATKAIRGLLKQNKSVSGEILPTPEANRFWNSLPIRHKEGWMFKEGFYMHKEDLERKESNPKTREVRHYKERVKPEALQAITTQPQSEVEEIKEKEDPEALQRIQEIAEENNDETETEEKEE